MADNQAIESLRGEFNKIDTDNTGFIDSEQLKEAMKRSSITLPDEEIERIIDEVDFFGNKRINFSEFLMAILDVRQIIDENTMQAIFA